MRKALFVFLVSILFLLLPQPAFSLDVSERIEVHGFLSQGYLISGNNKFFGDSKDDGTFEVNEIGVNCNARITDKFRLGAQVLSKDLGDVSNNEIRVDWAVADYRFSDMFGIRAGKVKLPMGLYNEGRDTDFLRPMVFLPQSIYDETRRDLLVGYVGGGIYGNIEVGAFGDLDYHIFGGEIDFPDEYVLLRGMRTSASSMIAANNNKPVGMRNPIIPSQLTDMELKSKSIVGWSLIFNTAIDGLRLGVSDVRPDNDIIVNGIENGEQKVKSRYVYSLEYIYNNFIFSTEYGETDRKQRIFTTTGIDGKTQEYYFMLTYSPLENLTLSALYDVFYHDKDDKDGSNFVAKNQPSYYGWRKDFGLGIRYDINQDWTIKADWHVVDGAALFMSVFNPAPTVARRYWNYAITKVTFNF